MAQEQYIHNHCPECGGKLKLDNNKRKLVCTSCDYTRNINERSDQVAEITLFDRVRFDEFEREMGRGMKYVSCQGCKGIIGVPKHQVVKNSCPFCGSNDWQAVEEANKPMPLKPFGIIPFTIPRKVASGKLARYLRKGNPIFLPPAIFKLPKEVNLRGVFVPMYLMDVFTRSTWRGQGGIRRTNNKKESYIAWEPTAGYWERFHNDLPVLASKVADGKLFDNIAPFDTKKVVPYDPAYLTDWLTEVYQMKEIDGAKKADETINKEVETYVKGRIKGSETKDLKINREKMLLTFRHVLVPVWMATFRYQGKAFQFMINGQNGRITGQRPLSFRRMYIAVGLIIALLVFLVLRFRWFG
ncbi:MAG: hypothetical protein AAFR61_07055 [Bacteroidota bacterium]